MTKELERLRKNYVAKVRRYGGENLGVGIHYTQGFKDGSAILDDVVATCKEAEALAISMDDRLEAAEKLIDELCDCLRQTGYALRKDKALAAAKQWKDGA